MNLSRMGGLGVAVAASLATVAAMLAPAVAQASASGGSPSPAVTHYTGTPGVARLVPRHQPAVGAPSAPRVARRLPSGHFSAAEAMPGAQASQNAPSRAAAAPVASAPTATAVARYTRVVLTRVLSCRVRA